MSKRPKTLKPGTRVRLRAPSYNLALESDLGTVISPAEYGDYYVIRLDAPALYDHGTGEPVLLTEVPELIDNMDVLPSNGQDTLTNPGRDAVSPAAGRARLDDPR